MNAQKRKPTENKDTILEHIYVWSNPKTIFQITSRKLKSKKNVVTQLYSKAFLLRTHGDKV